MAGSMRAIARALRRCWLCAASSPAALPRNRSRPTSSWSRRSTRRSPTSGKRGRRPKASRASSRRRRPRSSRGPAARSSCGSASTMPEGSRGSEGCKVHSVKPMEQLVFEWNAPPTIPAIRPLRTLVYLDFKAASRQSHRGDAAQLRLRRRRGLGQDQGLFRAGVARRDGEPRKALPAEIAHAMDLGFAGKIVVVTGASKGIGFACAEAFAREGARVALVSRSAANLDAALARVSKARRTLRRMCVADLVRADDAARMVDDVERDAGSDRRARQLGRRRAPLRAGRSRRRRVARGDGREVLQLHPSDCRGAAAHGRARPRDASSTSSVPAARSRAPCICREAPRTPR